MLTVSVIIPAYNAAATVAASIESVLAQTSKAFEIIVVNDGSSDETASALERYAGRIKVVTQQNRGPAAARNAGVRAATGEWIAFLDGDDTWTADKLEKTVAAVRGDSETVLVFSDATCIDESGTVLPRAFIEADRARAPSMDDMLAGRFQIPTSSVSVRRDAFERAGGFSEEFRSPSFEDTLFWIVLREQGPFAFVAARLVNYHSTSLARSLERYRPGFEVFARLVRERYGAAAEHLIRARRKARVTRWAHLGLLAMKRGDTAAARHAFRSALREDPRRLKNLMRLLRTYLPAPLARALTGRTRDGAAESAKL